MNTLLAPLNKINAYLTAKECIDRNNLPVHISGCIDSQKAHFIFGLSEKIAWKVIVVQNEIKAREFMEDYRMFDRDILYFPAKDVIFYSADVHGNAITAERLKVIEALLVKDSATIVTTMDAGLEKIIDLSIYKKAIVSIAEGDILDIDKLQVSLANMGYQRESQVRQPGEYSIRGGIVDIYPITADTPFRIDLWGDEIDTIKSFDADSQRSIERIEKLKIFPASEFIVGKDEIEKAFKNIDEDLKNVKSKFREEKNHDASNRISETIKNIKEDYTNFESRMGLESFLSYFDVCTGSLFDYFDKDKTVFFVDESERCLEKMDAVLMEFHESMKGRLEKGYILPKQMDNMYSKEIVTGILMRKKLVFLSTLDFVSRDFKIENNLHLQISPVTSYNKHFDFLIKDLQQWRKSGYSVLILSSSRTRAKRISSDLNDYEIPAFYSEDFEKELLPGQIMTGHGYLKKGFGYGIAKFIIITEGDIFGAKTRTQGKRQKKYSGDSIQSFHELSVGDYVVHENHGLGIYRGIEKIRVEGVTKDYVKVEYGDGGNLYVPVSGLGVLQKFADKDSRKPKLNKLNSVEWKKTKTKVKVALEAVAKELVLLYAKRQKMKGFAFGKDTVWQQEFEELFPFEETKDQLQAIEDTKRDMESTKIMDRLICGDVGYGKTEIAIRAAFKAVNEGKQVAFLVPTTILARQHYNTFIERLGDFPVKVEMLSRFRTAAQQKKTISLLKKGQVDIVIGTHRLLSKDISFKDLGLLIVDEEQRFGVTHKEKIKQMKGNVDVLTLSATPIPRTLHMSLVGIRDMSVLEEPPIDRLPIQTFVMEHNPEIIREAINRELARGGQVYYVYNRVRNIDDVTMELSELIPDANIAFAHGQMAERELEDIMMEFINGEIDVLVATTIIETGLDISNVNTIIIDNADQMGLSQLYQLRGRVGRSNRTSYAFLMYKRDKVLREVAEKRLEAIREYTELGSGIKIAMRDLEIRGAGNLLGKAQSGHMEAVGYDLYCKMLNEAVRRLKGEDIPETFETTIDIQLDALIPATYITSEFQKLDMYKRIAGIETKEELVDMEDELVDRFGEIPLQAENLLYVALTKSKAQRAEIEKIHQNSDGIRFYLHNTEKINPEKVTQMIENYSGKMKYIQSNEPCFVYSVKQKKVTGKGKNKREIAKELFELLDELVESIGGLYDKEK